MYLAYIFNARKQVLSKLGTVKPFKDINDLRTRIREDIIKYCREQHVGDDFAKSVYGEIFEVNPETFDNRPIDTVYLLADQHVYDDNDDDDLDLDDDDDDDNDNDDGDHFEGNQEENANPQRYENINAHIANDIFDQFFGHRGIDELRARRDNMANRRR